MTTKPLLHTPLALLVALGVIGSFGAAWAQSPAAVDTSQWKCETCPYPKAVGGAIELGVIGVSDASRRFGDFTGLQREGAHAAVQGEVGFRGDGTWAELNVGENFNRVLAARGGVEGAVSLRLDAIEIPRRLGDGARTPFLGLGSDRLTLPAGYPAISTAAMPLATTLQDAGLGYDYRRIDLGAAVPIGRRFTFTVDARRDVRDGTKPSSASFFNTAAQLALPLDHTTDQFEVALGYASRRLQARLAWTLSRFDNGSSALVWDNPFDTGTLGATRGRLALAPGNQFQQLAGSAGVQITPALRASADFAAGRATQDEPLVGTSLTPGLDRPLPAASLDGRVDTFNGNLRLSASLPAGVRVHASYSRDERNNRTGIRAWPQVAADVFLNPGTRSNTPFDEARDRYRLQAEGRLGALRLAGGLEQDNRVRNYHEVVESRETSAWVRGAMAVGEDSTVTVKLSHGDRGHSSYGVATWFGITENPLLRKYQLAERRRMAGTLRGDFTVSDSLALGVVLEGSEDDYHGSLVGLQNARRSSLGIDLVWTITDGTRLTAYAQTESMRSRQAGSQVVAAPDWTAVGNDRFEVVGLGLRHALVPDRLDVGADVVLTRARSKLRVDTGIGDAAFPQDRNVTDSIRLHASYKLSEAVTVNAGLWAERADASDWQLAGVAPGTLSNLLAFGVQPADYRLYVLRASVRYRF
jgi:MtrB/PioB family decaheme-associated outer membrane protein